MRQLGQANREFLQPLRQVMGRRLPFECCVHRQHHLVDSTGRDAIETTGSAARVVASAEKASIPADGLSLAYINLRLVDAQGRPVTTDDRVITAALSGPGCGAAAVGIYIALGALGMPVFAGFTGGLERIAGMTGGFIIGYLPCALIVGLMTGGKDVPVWRHAIGMAAGTLSCYICGILWFAAVTKSGLLYAAAVCVLPFLLPDAVKIAAAAVLCPRIRKAIPQLS